MQFLRSRFVETTTLRLTVTSKALVPNIMKILCPIILFFVLSIFNCQIFAQSEEIELIKINSFWTGLAPTKNSNLVIKRKKDGFYANGKKVETRLIDELLKQINSDEKQNLQSLGITSEWLNENAERILPENLKNALPNEKELFLNSFRNINLVEKILPRIFGSWTDGKGVTTYKYSTDDYPEFELEIRKRDGSTDKIASRQQTLFMFDNPKLGKAIAALLPQKFTNRGRLNGDYLAREIAKEISDEIKEDLNRLQTQNRIGSELAQLNNKYIIRKTAINHISSIDVGTPKNVYQTNEYKKYIFPSWNAELHRNDLPQNVIVGVSLPYKENKLITFPAFLEKIDRIVQQTLSVPWLSKYIADNSETEFEIRFVENRSLSAKAKESFLEDLNKFGANGLNAEILKLIDECVFLEVSEKSPSRWSRWLILPDKRMILWQINGESVLKWKPSDFETRNLYDTKDWFQSKAIISPEGKIESR